MRPFWPKKTVTLRLGLIKSNFVCSIEDVLAFFKCCKMSPVTKFYKESTKQPQYLRMSDLVDR
jgi:hypothetical protein